MTKQVDELMKLASEYAKAFSSNEGYSHARYNDLCKAIDAALNPGEPEPKCNPHPKAPHGFNRNASHSVGRYVCDCESWDAYEAGYQNGLMDAVECTYDYKVEESKHVEPMRAYVEQFAAKGGWTKDSGEGAFEFVQRISYAQGVEDGRNRPSATPRCEPVTDEENEQFRNDLLDFNYWGPEATKYALNRFLKYRTEHGIGRKHG